MRMRYTSHERRALERARKEGRLGKEVVLGSRPATEAQMRYLRALCRRLGLMESEAVKAALGKRPVQGLNRERASAVIEYLLSLERAKEAES